MATRKGSKGGKTPKAGSKKKASFEDAVFKASVKLDPKSKNFSFKIGTPSGQFEFEKSQKDTLLFVESFNKKHGKKGLKSIQAKNKNLKGNSKQLLTYIKEWMNTIAKTTEVATDKQIHDWMGAQGTILNDLQSGIGGNGSKKSKEESKEAEINNNKGTVSMSDHQQLQRKYSQAQQAIEQLKAEKDSSDRHYQQLVAELKSKNAQIRTDYEQLESKYDAMQETWEEQQETIAQFEKKITKKDYKDLESKFPHLKNQFGDYQDPDEQIEILKEEELNKQHLNSETSTSPIKRKKLFEEKSTSCYTTDKSEESDIEDFENDNEIDTQNGEFSKNNDFNIDKHIKKRYNNAKSKEINNKVKNKLRHFKLNEMIELLNKTGATEYFIRNRKKLLDEQYNEYTKNLDNHGSINVGSDGENYEKIKNHFLYLAHQLMQEKKCFHEIFLFIINDMLELNPYEKQIGENTKSKTHLNQKIHRFNAKYNQIQGVIMAVKIMKVHS